MASVLAGGSGAAPRAQGAFDRLLGPADVEKVSGEAGVKAVPKGSKPGACGNLNFVRSDGRLILMANFGDARLYQRARAPQKITVGGNTSSIELFAHAVPGLGDEAFASPPGVVQYVIYARKGNNAVSIGTFFSRDGKTPLLTEAQLKQIAALVLSRE